MTGQDPEPVLKSLREGAPVIIQYKGKSYRFPNQKAADEFKRRRQAGE
jgi:YHS domain-containing protein